MKRKDEKAVDRISHHGLGRGSVLAAAHVAYASHLEHAPGHLMLMPMQ